MGASAHGGHEHGGHAHGHEHHPGEHAHEHEHRDHAHERGAHDHGAHDHDHGGHDHDHDHAAALRQTPLRRLVAAFVVTAGFMGVEAVVGFYSKSLALVADAGHMLADAAALALAIFAQRIASQARTRARTYGHRRAEVLAAFANGVALALTAVFILVEAVERWSAPPAIEAAAMTATALLGLFVNLGSAAVLSAGAHGHNVNTRAALAHVLSDALGSVGATIAGVLILTKGWVRADAIISAVIAALILLGGWRLVRDTSRVLMEGSPIEIDLAHVEATLLGVPGVVGFHDLHVWSISDGFDVLTVHVVIDRGHHGIDVVAAVAKRLEEKHGIGHVTIQPEPIHDDRLVTLRRKSKPPVG
jgi:cobalt-zinc-cadmium efflux system protein